MSSAFGSGAKIERILIVRLSAMGDVIHTLPAAQALRDAFPDAMIGWLIEERWAEIIDRGETNRPVGTFQDRRISPVIVPVTEGHIQDIAPEVLDELALEVRQIKFERNQCLMVPQGRLCRV